LYSFLIALLQKTEDFKKNIGIKNEIEDEPVIKLSTSLIFLSDFVCIILGGFVLIFLLFL
jgi:hypothetical protein